jgi:hypothetical protein
VSKGDLTVLYQIEIRSRGEIQRAAVLRPITGHRYVSGYREDCAAGSDGTVGFRDATGSALLTAPTAPTADKSWHAGTAKALVHEYAALVQAQAAA